MNSRIVLVLLSLAVTAEAPADCFGAAPSFSFPDTMPDVILSSQSAANLNFGRFVASGSDVNGDGYDDFATTADKFDDCRGRAFLYFGGKDRVYGRADHIFDGEDHGNFFGQWIILTDLNNDEYGDVVVGAVGHNNWQGRVYVYFGGPSMDDKADMIFDGEPDTYSWFGRVLDASDIDKDGHTDLLVNAIAINEGRGRAYLYYGGDHMDTIPDKIFDGENPGDAFGRELDMGSDVNGDGYGDIIFGSRSWNAPKPFGGGQGRAYLYYGGPNESMDTKCDKIFTGDRVGDEFGSDVCLFDIDGDNYAEVLVGARRHGRSGGRVFTYWGGKDMDTQPDLILNGEMRSEFGSQIDCGNLNDDKYGDILVTAYNYGHNHEGKIHLYYGAPKNAIDVNCDHTFTGEGSMFGGDLSIGDINGDSYDDFIIAAGLAAPINRAYVYYTKPFPAASGDIQPQFVKEISEDVKPIGSIHKAAADGDINQIVTLISKGVNVNSLACEDGKMTPLHKAAIAGHKDVVEILLSHGARIDALDNMAISPLHRAAEHGHMDVVKLLIDKGADINRKDIVSISALHYASEKGHREVVRLLIARGAEVDAKDARGRTPVDLASQGGHTEIVELLQKHGAKESQKDEQSFQMAILSNDLAKVQELISQGTDVNVRDLRGNTPLHQAIMMRRLSDIEKLSLIEILISAGADVNAKNRRGRTPVDFAQRAGNNDIVALLRKQMLVHDVAVSKVSATPSCTQGETVPITIILDNQGDCRESCAVKLMDVTNGREIARQSATIHSKHRTASEADLTITGEVEDDTEFGNWCCADGDVNGDGFNDLLITAHHYPSKSVDKGRAYVYYGGPNMDGTPDKRFTGEEVGDTFGGNSGLLVDMNNDNFDDVVIGARNHDGKGRVYIFNGGYDMDEEPDIIIDPPVSDGTSLRFGRGGMHAGDFNGDGIMDLVCSAIGYKVYIGRVYLYYGPLASDKTADKIFTGETPGGTFGPIIGVGDVNRDKCDDLLVATRYFPALNFPTFGNEGRAYFYYGAPGTSMDTTCDVMFDPPDGGKNEFGSSADVFDIDNDGFADVLIGARRYPDGKSVGRAYVYWGKPNGFDSTVGLTITGEAANTSLGGDFINCRHADHDQHGDILITAYDYNRQQSRAYLYNGGPQGSMDTVADHIFTPEPGRNGVFRSVLADLNNDSYGDVVMAGAYYNNLQGRAWLWYGPFTTSADITFNWDTTNASIGKHTLKIEIPPVPGEHNTEDNVKTVTVEVKESPR